MHYQTINSDGVPHAETFSDCNEWAMRVWLNRGTLVRRVRSAPTIGAIPRLRLHSSALQSLSPPASPPSPRAGSPREPRRTHLHAEQKRRYNIKNGFDTLQSLIPHLNTNPAAKVCGPAEWMMNLRLPHTSTLYAFCERNVRASRTMLLREIKRVSVAWQYR